MADSNITQPTRTFTLTNPPFWSQSQASNLKEGLQRFRYLPNWARPSGCVLSAFQLKQRRFGSQDPKKKKEPDQDHEQGGA